MDPQRSYYTMNALSQLGYWFMPEQLLLPAAILLLSIGLFLRFVGLRRIARSMIVAAIGLVALPVVLGPVAVSISATNQQPLTVGPEQE